MARKSKNTKPIEYTLETISEDDLWFLADYDVMVERDFDALYDNFSAARIASVPQLRSLVNSDNDLDRQYNDILECAFENWDTDH